MRYNLLILLVVLTSCSSILEQVNPNKETEDSFFETEDEFAQALISAYTPLRNPSGGYYNVKAIQTRNIRADDTNTRNDEEPVFQLAQFTNTPDNAVASQLFEQFYSGIYRTNKIIEKIQSVDLSEDFKTDILGQAYGDF